MMRRRLGDEDWWRAIHHYVSKHKGQSVETKDLRLAVEESTGRSFERFFHDWTARPGHPVVEVSHSWRADRKLMEVRVKQTQKGEAFHFPLRLEYHIGATKLGITHDVNRKESSIMVPLPARPRLVRVDPDYAVLMELKEKKARDWWIAQLQSDPDVTARIRAAEHFGGERKPAARSLLAQAYSNEKAWPVQAELATAMGRAGEHAALLRALGVGHPKVRKSVVDALGKFPGRNDVRAKLAAIVASGDASYYVEAAAIAAWARSRPADGVATLLPLLERDSHTEVIRQAVLRGLGKQQDPAALETLVKWTRRGKPRSCRRAALEGLGSLAEGGRLDDAQIRVIVDAAQSCLHRLEHRGIKSGASELLRGLGTHGSAALPALQALADHDPNSSVRKQAKEAIAKIEAGAPAHLQLQRLRKQLSDLQSRDKKMREKLEQLERKHPEPVK
jgi:aminopeptidase N